MDMGLGLLDMFGANSQAGGGLGILGQIAERLRNNSGALAGYGSNGAEGMNAGRRSDMFAEEQQRQKMQQAMKVKAAQMQAQALGIDPVLAAGDPDTVAALYRQKMTPQKPPEAPSSVREFQFAKSQGYKGSFEDWQTRAAGGTANYSLNPIYGTDEQGNPVAMQTSSRGGISAAQMPQGVKLSRDPIKMDAGTHFVLLDPITRQQVGTIPKNVAGAAAEEEIGKAQGQRESAAPNQIDSSTVALDLVKQIEEHPGRQGSTGWQANFPTLNGTQSKDFENLVEQAKSGAFLTAIQQMRGLGALSDAEGRAATAAVTRMNVATSDEGFMRAVRDYKQIVERGRTKAQNTIRSRQGATPQGGGPAADPLGIR
jgi:hypothetical protein